MTGREEALVPPQWRRMCFAGVLQRSRPVAKNVQPEVMLNAMRRICCYRF